MTSSLSMNPMWLPVAFRDTALTVTTLGWQFAPSSFETLRQRCREQIQRLRVELNTAGLSEDVVQDAVYAQCALLDEAALIHLKDGERDAWEREPLQVAEFGTHDAGDALIDRMQQRLRQPQPARPLLAIFHAVLTLGFRGRLALEGPDVRAAMVSALDERLGGSEGTPGGIVVRSSARRRGFAPLSLPACVLVSIVAAGVAWVLLDRWLGTAAAQLLR
ncbi:DotU family type IV/VI secretion system protein [Dyella sp. M7H15-1]|uniref:DotU/TssL family secretion system protein n=1 Tax=Dyella sp. M7H15-1 TaxID=2501295 RepID=UPI001004FFFC|nr:DotU/TssL family secretion system protein [Dyella sp. M7H15-1]QAU23557.1 DotU family type IV/VI secretion system protein [Dyella sp. M7H15-1]